VLVEISAADLQTAKTVYADNVKLLGYDINTIKKNTEALIDTSNKGCLEVNIAN
jgi:hypothetical protein